MMRSLLVGLLVLLCTTSIIAKFTPHECIYDQMQAEVSKLRTTQKRAVVPYATTDLPNASNTQNLRIRIDTSFMDGDTTYTCYNVGQTITVANSGTSQGQQYSCKATDIATASIRSYLTQTLIPAAVDLLSNTFKVVPVVGNLRVGGGSCPGGAAAVPIPSNYVTTGAEDTDLIVFVLVRPVVGSSALAYAAGCQDDQYGRTVVGYININPASTSSLDGDRISQVGTIAHELSHVLGFNSDKFSGGLRTSAGTGQSGIVSSGGVNTMVTENVVAFARTYFNCPNLEGALIENGGGGGTAGSHWEKEQWMNEYMTGISTQNPVFSGLTLSFFQDSGWYYIDFARAEQLFWGYQAGCNFAAGCEAWPSGNGYTCDKSNDKLNECTFDLQGKGYCDTDVLTSESCPYINGYNNAWCIDKDDAAKTLLNSGEEYCPECRCFTSSLIKNSPTGGTDQLVCYKTDCVNPSQLKVKVNDFWYNCNRKGDTVAAINFGGTIKCPDPALICAGAPAVPEQWPQILAINPDTGVPGSVVTITGKNFYNITQVYIAGDCTEVSVESPTKLTARLATYDKIQNPTNLLKAKANVIVTNSQGHNDLIYQGYNLKIELNQDLADAALRWVKDKWYVVLIAGLVLGVFIFICYRCCCKSKKDEEGQHKGQHKGHKKHGGHQGQRRQTGGDVHMHQIQPQPGQQHQQEFYEAEPNYYENQQYYAQQQQQPQHHQQPPKRQLV